MLAILLILEVLPFFRIMEGIMYGTISGNIAAILYLIAYQFCGIIISDYLFNKEKKMIRLLIGSVIGSFLLMWLPTISSLIFDFNVLSHMLAIVLLLVIMLVVIYSVSKKKKVNLIISRFDSGLATDIWNGIKDNIIFIILFGALAFLYALLLNNHVLLSTSQGIYCGQCTYGDMNMHLGFITSIANQGTFPPDYSIMPGEKLCYPFLCDSISSSLYIFGSSLKLAYCLPMMVAFLQVLGGFYVFANQWLKDRAKSVVAFVLFFLNGGFGFLYFLNVIGDGSHSISEIFTEFYHTPTNFTVYNIRWVNVIADMLLPQRATLFGWSILFVILFILWRAHFEKKEKYFYIAGVLAGGLVMIHTHSFLALGIICAVWLMFRLVDLADIRLNISEKSRIITRGALLVVSITIMSLLRKYDLANDADENLIKLWFGIGIAGIIIYLIYIIMMMIKLVVEKNIKPVLKTWGAFLAVVLPLALAQLFTWTFRQTTGDNFVRGQFNWANIDDEYLVFYIKNIGLVLIFIILALLVSKKESFRLAMCGIAIWFIAEFLGFQPNEYDNNKLLYIGFIFLLIPAASIMVDMFKKIRPKIIAVCLAAVVMCVCVTSAILTLGREYVSEYQLYANEYMEIVDYINSSDVPADAMILTHTHHNNAVSSLTGRNIVVGAGTFLYYHGFDTYTREAEVRSMFEEPEDNLDLFEKYNVTYVAIGSQEMNNYDIDYDWYYQNSEILYKGNHSVFMKIN